MVGISHPSYWRKLVMDDHSQEMNDAMMFWVFENHYHGGKILARAMRIFSP